jgi:hypothetical protein
MYITHELLIDCSNITAVECSDKCLEALGHGVDFCLKASTPTDTCNGSVTIDHGTPHIVIVECYDHDEAPCDGRESTLACCADMPTEQTLKDRLDTLKETN